MNYEEITADELWNEIFPEKTNKTENNNVRKIILFGNGLTLRHHPDFTTNKILESMKNSNDDKLINCALSGKNNVEEILYQVETTLSLADKLSLDTAIYKKLRFQISEKFKLAIADLTDKDNVKHMPTGFGKWLIRFDDIMSLCYDLFAYLSLIQQAGRAEFFDLFTKDGQGTLVFASNEFREAVSLKNRKNSLLMHLHGSLLYYWNEDDIKKYYYSSSDKSLCNLLSRHNGQKPTCVVGGTGNYKLSIIKENPYLNFCWSYFNTIMSNEQKKDILVFGASLTDKDSHIVNVLKNVKNADVYLSYRKGSTLEISDNKKMIYHHINDYDNNSKCFFVKISKGELPFEHLNPTIEQNVT